MFMRDTNSLQNWNKLLDLFNAAIDAVNPCVAVRNVLSLDQTTLSVQDSRPYVLDRYDRICVVGCGKAGAPMAFAVEDVLHERISGGIVTVKSGHTRAPGDLQRIRLDEAAHPTPDERGEESCRAVLRMLEHASGRDLVIAVISGGGSALWPLPAAGLTLQDEQATTNALLGCGASIQEMNIVRKHISAIKGGLAARAAHPATVIALLISDVPGNDPATIASGPFAADVSTFNDARAVIDKYKLASRVPPGVQKRLQQGCAGLIEETPGPQEACFSRGMQCLCATNEIAVRAAARRAGQLGYEPVILTTSIAGDVRDATEWLFARIHAYSQRCDRRRYCLLSAGETTVNLPQIHGRGGRNQHMALAMAKLLCNRSNITFLSCGTDGTDGPTDVAGALVDGHSWKRMLDGSISPDAALENHCSYDAVRAAGLHVITGPTATNVMDVQIALIDPGSDLRG
ncbi:MAG: DUF4147 domain-containing protein [Chitinivibrionales bacterium]|nr:DUF4147 domain-containing protein [Chitinivibrionales bacterium]